MNEYTRREEIRWTLATVFILVPSVAIAIVRLALAEGPMVEDPKAIAATTAAKEKAAKFRPCIRTAQKLDKEVKLFKSRAAEAKKKAEKEAEDNRPRNQRNRDDNPEVEFDLPWSSAEPVLKYARNLEKDGCEKAATGTVEAGDAKAAWAAASKAAKIKDPGNNKKKRQKTARKLLSLFDKAPLDKLESHAKDVDGKLQKMAEAAAETQKTELVRAPLPRGLFPLGLAIAVGVGVSLAAFIISYISVRSASVRRARTLVALRRFANTPEAGLQAAAIVRLAAHHNGGEPGMVIGAATGGLLAAILSPTDNPNIFIADLFVAGSMGGLLIGLAAQWLARTLSGVSRWRERTKELGDIEKPTIPVALVLGGVTPGLEKQFLRYFEALPVADAATVVQKLAAQAEEQILAAADAANQGGPPMGGGWQPGPGG